MTVRPVGAELFQAAGRPDGRTGGQAGMTKLVATF
jgi:hypothetical protein